MGEGTATAGNSSQSPFSSLVVDGDEAGLVEVQLALDAAQNLIIDAALVAQGDGGLAFDAERFAGEIHVALMIG